MGLPESFSKLFVQSRSSKAIIPHPSFVFAASHKSIPIQLHHHSHRPRKTVTSMLGFRRQMGGDVKI